MKRFTYCIAALLMGALPCSLHALTLPEEQPALVYYMPLTQLQVTVEYDETVTEVGPFYQYSERYLGTKDVQTKAERQFVLNSVRVTPTATADTSRVYIPDDKNVKLQLLSYTPFGTLAGYNLSAPTLPRPELCHPPMPARCESTIGTENTRLMPLLEEQLMASSMAKMAEGAAKQLYRIRETRLNILAGDVEKAPADGEALKQILHELDRREQELTALFVGRRNVVHHTHHVTYTPKANGSKEEGILLRFSKYYGIVAADDLSGEPVKIAISKHTHSLVATDKPAQKAGASIYYNLPGNGEMTVTYGDQTLVSQAVAVAQWGVSVPLSAALIATTPHITFCPLTGAIVGIEK